MISTEDNKKRKQRIECETVGDTVFTVIVEENPTAENTALDIIGTIIRQNTDRNVGKISKDNKGRICYLDTITEDNTNVRNTNSSMENNKTKRR